MENKDFDELFRKSLLTIRNLKKQVADCNKDKDKVAIIGMACRFPGDSDTPEKFFQLLREGRSSQVDIPKSRFDITDYYDAVHGKPGKMYVKQESFLEQDIAEFDAKFFGISSMEANDMDPQQRLLCEVSWEALENAGQDIQELKGSKTGVFLGISSAGEYSKLSRDASKVNQYTGTGNISSIASGRLSYLFGLNGPSISIDTACSSSLVSTHLAVKSLEDGECDMAISAGVNLMISPEVMSSLCAMNALSEDGTSKPFDENANGYGRGEGCGVIVLKRLSDALRDHDHIYAIIEGSAVNNDGESSSLTVPNGKSQQKVILDAVNNAGISPDDIDYIETHGTGTLLGDPIEFDAIKEVFLTSGHKRKTDLKIGAVKGNIGHLEAAAGIASIINAALCLTNKTLVPIANFHNLNTRIKSDGLPVEFLTECKEWNNHDEKPNRMGISSFGFSGTNAHMVLCQAPELAETSLEMPQYLLHLSAKTEKGVVELVKRYKKMFEQEDINLCEVCYTANCCREKFAHCVVLRGKRKQDFIDGFDRIVSLFKEKETIYIAKTQLTGSSEGEDRLDAKRQIYEQINEHIFTARIDQLIHPKFTFIFHDQGEGIFETAKEIYRLLPSYRAKLDVYLEKISKRGYKEKFLEYQESEKNVVSKLFLMAIYVAFTDFFSDMDIHCEAICGQKIGDFAAAVVARIMSFDTAISSVVSYYEGNQETALTKSNIHRPVIRYVCNATSSMSREVEDLYQHFHQNVYQENGDYTKTIQTLYEQGYRFFMEFGKDDKQIPDILHEEDVITLDVLHHNVEMGGLLEALANSITFGSNIKWNKFFEGLNINKISLPNYPFDKAKHWIAEPPKSDNHFNSIPKSTEKFNAMEVILPFESKQYQFTYSNSNFREVQDNSGVIHMGYYLEMLQNVMNKQYPNKVYVIEQMDFTSAIILMDEEVKEVLIVLDTEGEKISFQIYNKNSDLKDWNRNMKGTIVFCTDEEENIYNLEEIKQSCMEKELEEAVFYNPLEKEKGFYFGHAVRWVQTAFCSNNDAYVKFRSMDADDIKLDYNIGIHPGILDSCAQTCNFVSIAHTPIEKKYMVNRMKHVKVYPQHYMGDCLSAHIHFNDFYEEKGEVNCRFTVFNAIGEAIVEVGEISLKEFDETQLGLIKNMMEHVHHGAGQDSNFLMQFMQASVERKKELLTQYVVAIMAEVLGEEVEHLDVLEPMDDLGLDSMSGLDFYNKITERLGVEMPFAQLAQCKNLQDSANKIYDKLQGKQTNNEDAVAVEEQDFSLENWIHNYKDMPGVKARIFCFPNGFRSADMFDSWQEQLGDEIQVCPIKIPGMDMSRISEKAPVQVDEFIETLIQVLEQGNLLDVPCTSFGHSWGSLFSYRLGYFLNERKGVNYFKLFVSGYTSPARKNSSVKKILEEIKNQGFHNIPIYEEIKQDKEAVNLIVKSFQKVWGYDEKGTRAVINLLLSATGLIDRYEFNPKEKMKVPIVAFHGIDDYVVEIDEMNLWEDVSSNGFKLYTMKGDHQFVNENQSEKQLLETLKEEILGSL